MAGHFSERLVVSKAPRVFQKDCADEQLRTDLWNVWYAAYWEHDTWYGNSADDDPYLDSIWTDILHLRVNELHRESYEKALHVLQHGWFDGNWYECYDILEATMSYEKRPSMRKIFADKLNSVLVPNLSAYRFIDGHCVPITTDEEVGAVQAALRTPLSSVQEHIHQAVVCLSNRKDPDFRNSIKESISAVEAICTTIVGKPHATLKDALARIETKVPIHKAQKEAFQRLYGYTSDAEGIRHALLEKGTLTADDAKFMLVACSAFIEFLVSKADQAGIVLGKPER
jgi:hypothetical protein